MLLSYRIGAPSTPLEISPFSLIQKRLNVTGSFIGGMKETQEMLDFSGQHNITCKNILFQSILIEH
jgi:uncharacterized zinc-type alcohol dehydrogenase-like protein